MFGQVSRVVISCAAFSPLLSGFLFDISGSYRVMFLFFACATVVVALFIPLLKFHQPVTVP
jgi:cyanate permease